jgi:hypothetical protein
MPSEYEQQAMEARRRRRMAEMLAAQAYQPQDVGVAPIPSAAPLVQGLQAFLTARQLKKAEEAEQKASETESEYAKRISGRLAGGYVPDFNVPAAEVPEQTELGEVTLTSQKRPAETLQQYQDRMRTAQFTSPTFDQMLARTPEQTTLEQITPTARYKRSPEEALAMAETDVGMAAMKNRPVLAARLAQLLEKPENRVMEFGGQLLNVSGDQATPITMGGKAVTAPSAAEATPLARLIAERDALPPNDPRRSIYDDAIAKETTRPSAPVTNVYSTTAVAGVDEEGNPIFFQPSRGGGQPSIIEGVRPAPKGMNEGQAKAAGFADRIFEANPVFEQGAIPFEASMVSQLPLGVGNYALTPQQQSFLQAERNFINAVLRRESGAVISDEEFKNARQQYIPQPGDSPQVIAQKKRNRETVLNSLSRDAGPSYRLPASSMQGSGFGETGGWGQAEVVR